MHRTKSRLIRGTSVCAALAAIAATMAFLTPAQAATEAPFVKVGALERFPADAVAALGADILPEESQAFKANFNGTLVNVPQRRELWQMYMTTDNNQGPTRIAIRDAESLQLRRTLSISAGLRRVGSDLGGEWMHTFDGDRRIFFMDAGRRNIIEVDLGTLAQRQHPIGAPFVMPNNQALQGFLPGALAYDPVFNAVIILYGGPPSSSAADVNTFIQRIDLATDVVTTRQIRACNGSLPPIASGLTYQVEPLLTKEHAFFVCHRAGAVGTVVRIALNELMLPSSIEDIVVGPVFLETALADPASGRMFLVTIGGEIWAFDTRAMAFVGVVAAAAEGSGNVRSGYGLDRATGRLFFLSDTYGIGIAEGRFFPIPQARTISSLKSSGQERIISDTKTNRFFVLPGSSGARDKTYSIYQAGPAPTPPPLPDPDRSTTDLPEREGVTESRFFASGSGYGLRAIMAKGISTLAPAPTIGQIAPTAQIIDDYFNSRCGYSDREMVAGRVKKAEYDTGSTAAQAVGIDIDERTKLDMEHLERCDVYIRSGNQVFPGIFPSLPPDQRNAGKPWEGEAAVCANSAGEDGDKTDTGTEPIGASESSVKCPLPGKELTAKASAQLEGNVKVGRAYAETSITRSADFGIRSSVTSVAKDVAIAGGLVKFAEIRSTATSTSNGRPKSEPMSTHTVTVTGATFNTETLCKDVCDLRTVIPRLNSVLGGKVEFRSSSGIDEALKEGTPRGALTAVQKAVARQASDQALIGDFSTEVPGLEMVVYNDNTEFGRARQLYQFAGVSTAATYNVVPVPPEFGFDADGDGEITDEDDEGFDDAAFSPAGPEGEQFLPGVGDLPDGLTPASSSSDGVVDTIKEVLRALGRGIRLFWSNPRQALLLLTAWALFSLPPVLSRRRRLLAIARSA